MLRKKIFFLTPFNEADLHMSMEFVTFGVGELEGVRAHRSSSGKVIKKCAPLSRAARTQFYLQSMKKNMLA